jgi:imidazoleglycerol-phosphate dehydratase
MATKPRPITSSARRRRNSSLAAGRVASLSRSTAETQIRLELNLDGDGSSHVNTGIPFLDHMLILLAKHGQFNLTVEATGDLSVDYHHLVEDVGIVLGLVLKEALGNLKGISRFAHAAIPIDEALCLVAIDISGRGYLMTEAAFNEGWIRDFDLGLLEEFFRAFAMNATLTLHIRMLSGVNAHHRAEAAFKAFARALRDATRLDSRITGIPSTKGLL